MDITYWLKSSQKYLNLIEISSFYSKAEQSTYWWYVVNWRIKEEWAFDRYRKSPLFRSQIELYARGVWNPDNQEA